MGITKRALHAFEEGRKQGNIFSRLSMTGACRLSCNYSVGFGQGFCLHLNFPHLKKVPAVVWLSGTPGSLLRNWRDGSHLQVISKKTVTAILHVNQLLSARILCNIVDLKRLAIPSGRTLAAKVCGLFTDSEDLDIWKRCFSKKYIWKDIEDKRQASVAVWECETFLL